MLGFDCNEYYCQEIVAIVFIVLGKMAVASDSISEESPRYTVKFGAKGHHFIEAVVNARDVIVCLPMSLVYYFTPSTCEIIGRCELIAMYARPSLLLRASGVYR